MNEQSQPGEWAWGALGLLLGVGLAVLAVTPTAKTEAIQPPLPPLPPPAPPEPIVPIAPIVPPPPREHLQRSAPRSSWSTSLLLHAAALLLLFASPSRVFGSMSPALNWIRTVAHPVHAASILPSRHVRTASPILLPAFPEPALPVFAGLAPAATDSPIAPDPGITIAAAADDGGALADLGVFRRGTVITQYLAWPPGWTLESARLFPLGPGEPVAGEPMDPPLPAYAPEPTWTDSSLSPGTIVIAADLDGNGRPTRLQVVASPDARLNAPLLAVLSRWRFRPARVNQVPVPTRILIGAPLLPR